MFYRRGTYLLIYNSTEASQICIFPLKRTEERDIFVFNHIDSWGFIEVLNNDFQCGPDRGWGYTALIRNCLDQSSET